MFMMTRKHTQRLRWYWQGKGMAASLADNIDLDLAGNGYIERASSYGSTHFKITSLGEHILYLEKEKEIERRSHHHSLGAKLAEHLRQLNRLVWENIEFKAEVKGAHPYYIRPDVYSLVATYDEKRLCPIVHEIKLSRADFFADIRNQAKRDGYRSISDYVYYVAPQGIIKPEEVPEGFGFIEEHDGKWETIKKGAKQRCSLRTRDWMNLIIKGNNRDWN